MRLAACAAGLRYRGRPDLTLIELAPGTHGRRRVHAEPAARPSGALVPRDPAAAAARAALVVNAGQANVMVGPGGRRRGAAEAEAAAALLGARPEEIYVASTGVIGERLEVATVVGQAAGAPGRARAAGLGGGRDGDHDHRHLHQGQLARARIGDAAVTIAASPRARA